jgi:hypothetical protein
MNSAKLLSFVIFSMILFACQPAEMAPTSSVAVTEEGKLTEIVAVETPTFDSGTTSNQPFIANCLLFPANNIWNAHVDALPIHPMSDAWIDSIGRDESFHMDFGSGIWDGGPIGIPYNVVNGSSVTKYTV